MIGIKDKVMNTKEKAVQEIFNLRVWDNFASTRVGGDAPPPEIS